MLGFLKRLFAGPEERRPFCSAILAAGGSSSRMGGENKLFVSVGGIPVLARSVLALAGSPLVDEIVIAVREEDLLAAADLCKAYGLEKPLKIVVGGATRLESVMAALLECSDQAQLVAVHDGARPLVTREIIDRTIEKAQEAYAAAPAVPVKDTIKVAENGIVLETPDRSKLFSVQTPQVFDRSLLSAALQAAKDAGTTVTDDCSAVERLGKEVYLTEGSYENIKITTPEDLALAEAILERRGA